MQFVDFDQKFCSYIRSSLRNPGVEPAADSMSRDANPNLFREEMAGYTRKNRWAHLAEVTLLVHQTGISLVAENCHGKHRNHQ
jgi:hypothetical protein